MTTRELYVKVRTSSDSQAIAGTRIQFYDGNWFSSIVTSLSVDIYNYLFMKSLLKPGENISSIIEQYKR